MNFEPPEAEVVSIRGRYLKIRCPLTGCGQLHEYEDLPPGRTWRAPQCGLYRSPTQRQIGYVFTVPGTPPEPPAGPLAQVVLHGTLGDAHRTATVTAPGDHAPTTVRLHIQQKRFDWHCDAHPDRGTDRCTHIRATNKALKRESRQQWKETP